MILRLAFIGLLAAAPAAAEELSFGKPPPAKASRPKSDHCAAVYGEGFSDIAGTGACVKIGGRVRVDFGAGKGASSAPSLPDKGARFGAAAEGAAEADYRQPVLGQTLRVFARVRSGAGDDFLLRGNQRQ